MTTTTQQDDLAVLWKSASRDAATQFLKQTIEPEQTFAQLAAALAFAGKHADLNAIRLGDVLSLGGATGHDAEPPEVRHTALGRAPGKQRAQRRSPNTTRAIRDVVVTQLAASPRGLITPEIGQAVRDAGHPLDNQKVNLLLNSMENAGLVRSDDSRPKRWYGTAQQGRRVPDPVVIRKANPAPLPPVAAAAPAARGGELLSPAEIKAAAAALHDRFFATKAVR